MDSRGDCEVMKDPSGLLRTVPYRLIAAFLLLVVGIGCAGYLFFESEKQEIRRNKQSELSSIAELKLKQIAEWRKERLADAGVCANHPLLRPEIRQFLENQSEHGLQESLLLWMRTIKESYDYDSVALVDGEGAIELSTSDGERLDSAIIEYLPEAAREKKPILTRLYREDKENSIRLAAISPILDRSKEEAPVVGFLLLRIDPNKFLYPFVQSWPTPSRTSETLLIRREGESVLYLNELRHRKGAALSLKMPLGDEDLPAAIILRGGEGMIEGVDYRSVPVLASLRRIPDSPWSLVAKVDIEEVYQPIREQAWMVSLLAAALIAGAGVCFSLIWSYQRAAMLEKDRDELEAKVGERTSDLARANEWLREQAALLELAHDAILVRDAEDRITYWSRGAEETYGWKREEALGRMIHELLKTEFPEPLDGIKERVIKSGEWQGELRHLTREGVQIIVESRWALQRDEDGAPTGILEINRDVTIRCKAQEELRLDEARFEALYKMSQMMGAREQEIIDFALEEQIRITRSKIGSINFLNEDESIAKIHGWSRSVMEKCAVADPPVHFPIAEAGVWAEAVRKREPIIINDYSEPHPAKKGYPKGHMRLTRLMSAPIFDRNRIVAVALLANKEEEFDFSDVRRVSLLINGMWRVLQQKRAEREKLLYTKKLELRNKELQDFAFIASHDLQEPLRKIQVFADRLMRKSDACMDAHIRDSVARMQGSANRMRMLVSDLLKYTQISMEPGPFSRVNLSDVLEEALIELEPVRERSGVSLEVGDLPVIDADRRQMFDLFHNLVGNALKFVDTAKSARMVRVYSRREGAPEGFCNLFIEDNGIGFDEKYLELIFTPFQRLHSRSKYEGSGIGLAICRKIVERHNGAITAKSAPGRGSTFIVSLPSKQNQGEESWKAAENRS